MNDEERVKAFMQETKGRQWTVMRIAPTKVPFLGYPAWLVGSIAGEDQLAIELVIEKDWRFIAFDITTWYSTNDEEADRQAKMQELFQRMQDL